MARQKESMAEAKAMSSNNSLVLSVKSGWAATGRLPKYSNAV
jgi:hypothetical protein